MSKAPKNTIKIKNIIYLVTGWCTYKNELSEWLGGKSADPD